MKSTINLRETPLDPLKEVYYDKDRAIYITASTTTTGRFAGTIDWIDDTEATYLTYDPTLSDGLYSGSKEKIAYLPVGSILVFNKEEVYAVIKPQLGELMDKTFSNLYSLNLRTYEVRVWLVSELLMDNISILPNRNLKIITQGVIDVYRTQAEETE